MRAFTGSSFRMIRSSFSRWLERGWYGSPAATLALLPLSWLFGVIASARRLAYRRGWLAVRRIEVPVIVVGNVTVGGTGKTPVVAALAEGLRRAGFRPGIVSRGYGARLGREPHIVRGHEGASEVGDEALLLAATGLAVCIARDRVAGARALQTAGCDVIVSDDGLQHYALARDLEIAVVDGARGLGNGRLLPAGPLRESPRRLEEVDLVLLNGPGSGLSGEEFHFELGEAVRLGGGERRALASFRGQRVKVLAGIGNPARFFAALEAEGLQLETVPAADHERLDERTLAALEPGPLLMTEKDAVKYEARSSLEAWYVPGRAVIAPRVVEWIVARVAACRPREGFPASPECA